MRSYSSSKFYSRCSTGSDFYVDKKKSCFQIELKLSFFSLQVTKYFGLITAQVVKHFPERPHMQDFLLRQSYGSIIKHLQISRVEEKRKKRNKAPFVILLWTAKRETLLYKKVSTGMSAIHDCLNTASCSHVFLYHYFCF